VLSARGRREGAVPVRGPMPPPPPPRLSRPPTALRRRGDTDPTGGTPLPRPPATGRGRARGASGEDGALVRGMCVCCGGGDDGTYLEPAGGGGGGGRGEVSEGGRPGPSLMPVAASAQSDESLPAAPILEDGGMTTVPPPAGVTLPLPLPPPLPPPPLPRGIPTSPWGGGDTIDTGVACAPTATGVRSAMRAA